MSLIRSFVALGVLLLSLAMAAEPAQESFLLKQQAQPTAPSAASVIRIKPSPSPSVVASAVTSIDITAVSIDAPATPLAVPLYGTIELVVTITTDVTGTQRFNPNPTTGGLDLHATFTGPGGSPVITRNGFYHGTSGKWLVRFAPTVIGAWTCRVTAKDPSSPTAGDTFSGVTFTCVTSTNPGFIRVSGSRLRFSDGSLFYGIGHNNGWQTDVEKPDLATMSTNGENLLSFWISQPWPHADTTRKPIENITDGIGNYEQATCDYLDTVFARAQQNGVYLLPSIWSHDALRAAGHTWPGGNWTNNAYSDPTICTSPLAFFVTTTSGNDSVAWVRQKNFFRYLTARYGHNTALAGWIGLVEMEGTSGYVSSSSTVITWGQKVRDWFIANDPYRVNGGSYPISFSKSDESSGNSANTLGATAGFPLHVADSYASKNSNSAIAATIATATRTMGGFGVVGGAPAFHTEFGAPVGQGASDPTHFHNAVWAGVSAGACLMPLKWCDAGSWPLFNNGTNYRDHTKYLSEFVNTTAVKTLMNNSSAVAATVTVPSGLGWGLKTADTGFTWLIRPAGGSIANTAVTVSGCSTGHYLIDWLNPWTNAKVSSTADITSGSTLTLTVPVSITTADVAVRFYRERVNSAPVATPLTITNAYAGQAKSIALAATDVDDDDTLTFATDDPPAFGILSATIGTPVTYTATAGYVGSDSFTYHANDGTINSAIVTVNITVLANLPPTANAQSVSVAQETAIGITLTGNDPDTVPNATLSFFVTANPTHGSLSGSPPFLTYLPTTGYTGADSFAFTVNDGALTSAAATVAITVIAGGVAPVPVGSTTSGGGCGLGGSAAAVLLGLMALLSCCSRLVRRRAD